MQSKVFPVRLSLASIQQGNGDWRDAANTLIALPLDSTSRLVLYYIVWCNAIIFFCIKPVLSTRYVRFSNDRSSQSPRSITSPEEKLDINLRIAGLLYEDDDAVAAETYINRATGLGIHSIR